MAVAVTPVTLYVGGLRPLPPEGQPTGIFKQRVAGPLHLGREGFAGDAQGDRRVHGGPEKAVHLYPAGHYARLAAAFPTAAALLVPGGLGENLSATGLAEDDVCIGDVYRLGGATLQVSRPRSPCWKIDRRLGVEGVMAHIAATGMTGWYFRVLAEGLVASGDGLVLLRRDPAGLTVLQALRDKQSARS